MKKQLLTLCLLIGSLCFMSTSLASQELSEKEIELLENAHQARKNAYAPYSQYFVGSSLSTKEGKTFSGHNIENASYGLSMCAERTAIFNAITHGHQDIDTMVVVTKDGGMPCGACRQVMSEFNPNMQIIVANEDNTQISKVTLSDILPSSFGPDNLESP